MSGCSEKAFASPVLSDGSSGTDHKITSGTAEKKIVPAAWRGTGIHLSAGSERRRGRTDLRHSHRISQYPVVYSGTVCRMADL